MPALWYWFVALFTPFPDFQKHFKGWRFWRLLIITNLIDRDFIKHFLLIAFCVGYWSAIGWA
jgi:hypothetical protein